MIKRANETRQFYVDLPVAFSAGVSLWVYSDSQAVSSQCGPTIPISLGKRDFFSRS